MKLFGKIAHGSSASCRYFSGIRVGNKGKCSEIKLKNRLRSQKSMDCLFSILEMAPDLLDQRF